jgi:hypothetical protein
VKRKSFILGYVQLEGAPSSIGGETFHPRLRYLIDPPACQLRHAFKNHSSESCKKALLYNWPAVLKSLSATAIRLLIVFSPSRTHTLGS